VINAEFSSNQQWMALKRKNDENVQMMPDGVRLLDYQKIQESKQSKVAKKRPKCTPDDGPRNANKRRLLVQFLSDAIANLLLNSFIHATRSM
jgi:hypothetical protein